MSRGDRSDDHSAIRPEVQTIAARSIAPASERARSSPLDEAIPEGATVVGCEGSMSWSMWTIRRGRSLRGFSRRAPCRFKCCPETSTRAAEAFCRCRSPGDRCWVHWRCTPADSSWTTGGCECSALPSVSPMHGLRRCMHILCSPSAGHFGYIVNRRMAVSLWFPAGETAIRRGSPVCARAVVAAGLPARDATVIPTKVPAASPVVSGKRGGGIRPVRFLDGLHWSLSTTRRTACPSVQCS